MCPKLLPIINGYTVDLRLLQARRVDSNHGYVEFIELVDPQTAEEAEIVQAIVDECQRIIIHIALGERAPFSPKQ